MRKSRALPSLVLAMALIAAPAAVLAYPGGIYDRARPDMGCGSGCHAFYSGTEAPGTTVLLFVDGAPVDDFEGYEPGREEPYLLTVWVLGPILPNAGFNLEATAGELSPVDASVRTIVNTECTYMGSWVTGCFGRQCKVVRDEECPVYDRLNPACKRCPTADENDETKCRPCDDTSTVDTQATHTERKPLPYFEMTWIPPAEPVDVEVFIAGNSVSGEGSKGFDIWNFADPNPLLLRPTAP